MILNKMLLPLLLIFSFFSFSQDWDPSVYQYGEQYPGYVIDLDGNKIEGFIKFTNRYDIQNTVVFFKEKGNKKTKEKYRTSKLKEYKMADKVYHCIHYSGGLMSKPIKGNLLIKEGCIRRYVWYNSGESNISKKTGETRREFMERRYPSVSLYFNQKSGELKTMSNFALGFSKKMSAFIKDNKQLSSKVKGKKKGYRMLALEAIIDEYNAECN